MSFVRYNTEDSVISSETVVRGLFLSNNGDSNFINNYFTSSNYTSSEYYLDVYNSDPLISGSVQFSIQFGNLLMGCISQWPFAGYVFHSSSIVELTLLYLIAIAMFIGFSGKKIKAMQIGLVVLCGFLIWKQVLENCFTHLSDL